MLDKLDTYGASSRGEPFDLPAGAVSIAIGVEGRNLSTSAKVSELDTAQAFSTFYFSGFSGKYNIKEAFAEIVVPVIKDAPLLRKLELNGAVRASDYNTSGTIWSRKLGLTNEFFPGVIGRVTRSRDIRAPNLTELFSTPTIGSSSIFDRQIPENGSNVATIYGAATRRWTPERADTWTAGITDRADARIDGIDRLFQHFDQGCHHLDRRAGHRSIAALAGMTASAAISRAALTVLFRALPSSRANLSEFKTDGIDASWLYTMPVNDEANGRVIFRLVGTWGEQLQHRRWQRLKIDYVKSQGTGFVNGVPRIRANASVGYKSDGFSGMVRARYISSGYYNGTLTLTNNRIPAYTYVDLQLSQKVPIGNGKNFELYGNVSNLFDKAPPISSGFSPYYDVVGRYMAIGARLEF